MRYHAACAITPAGPIPGPPKCLPGQAEGTVVQAVLVSSGEGAYAQPADLPTTWANWLGLARHVYAVKQQSVADELTGTVYHVVFVTDAGRGNTLRLSEAGIVGIGFDPGMSPRGRADGPPGTFLLPPR